MTTYCCIRCRQHIRFLPGWAAGCSGCGRNYCQDCAQSFSARCPECGSETFEDRIFATAYDPAGARATPVEQFAARVEAPNLMPKLAALDANERRRMLGGLAQLEAWRRLGLLDHRLGLQDLRESLYPPWWSGHIAALAKAATSDAEFSQQLVWRERLAGLALFDGLAAPPLASLGPALAALEHDELRGLVRHLERADIGELVEVLWPCLSSPERRLQARAFELLEHHLGPGESPWMHAPGIWHHALLDALPALGAAAFTELASSARASGQVLSVALSQHLGVSAAFIEPALAMLRARPNWSRARRLARFGHEAGELLAVIESWPLPPAHKLWRIRMVLERLGTPAACAKLDELPAPEPPRAQDPNPTQHPTQHEDRSWSELEAALPERELNPFTRRLTITAIAAHLAEPGHPAAALLTALVADPSEYVSERSFTARALHDAGIALPEGLIRDLARSPAAIIRGWAQLFSQAQELELPFEHDPSPLVHWLGQERTSST